MGDRLGLPYVCLREPLPFDTAVLNCNWQIMDTTPYRWEVMLTCRGGKSSALNAATNDNRGCIRAEYCPSRQ